MSSKKQISFRVDRSLLEWFKQKKPKGYQTLMHQVLESYVSESLSKKERAAGRAQELYRQYYAQCFWHYRPDLEISPENIHLVIEGLRKHGGTKGVILAEELCQ